MSNRGAEIKRAYRTPEAPEDAKPRVTAVSIRALREQLGLSMPAFAEALCLSAKSGRLSVWRWEHGLAIPSPEAQRRVADLAAARNLRL